MPTSDLIVLSFKANKNLNGHHTSRNGLLSFEANMVSSIEPQVITSSPVDYPPCLLMCSRSLLIIEATVSDLADALSESQTNNGELVAKSLLRVARSALLNSSPIIDKDAFAVA